MSADSRAPSDSIRNAIIRHYHGVCQYCGDHGADRIDHVVPHSRGGKTIVTNLILACVSCNARKSNGLVADTFLAIISAIAEKNAPAIAYAAEKLPKIKFPPLPPPLEEPIGPLCDHPLEMTISEAVDVIRKAAESTGATIDWEPGATSLCVDAPNGCVWRSEDFPVLGVCFDVYDFDGSMDPVSVSLDYAIERIRQGHYQADDARRAKFIAEGFIEWAEESSASVSR